MRDNKLFKAVMAYFEKFVDQEVLSEPVLDIIDRRTPKVHVAELDGGCNVGAAGPIGHLRRRVGCAQRDR